MGSYYDEYKICQKRKHKPSGPRIDGYEICAFCRTEFRHVTKVEERNVPAKP